MDRIGNIFAAVVTGYIFRRVVKETPQMGLKAASAFRRVEQSQTERLMPKGFVPRLDARIDAWLKK